MTLDDAIVIGGSILLQSDIEDHSYLDKDKYYEERGNPFKEQNRYQNEFRNNDNYPNGGWMFLVIPAAYSLYKSWPKPDIIMQTNIDQPHMLYYQQPDSIYSHYFMNLK